MKTLQVVFVSFLLLFTIHLSAQPTLDWQQTFNGGSSLVDKAVAIVHDNSCNTIVVTASDSLGQGVNIVTIKYDENGNLLWQVALDGPDHLDDVPTGLTVDQSDNIYICGKSQGNFTGFDYITMKYNPDGTPASGAWPVRYNNTNMYGNGYDAAKSISVYQPTGDVFVGGESTNHYGGLSGSDAFIIKYSSQGMLLDTVGGVSGGDATLKQIGITNSGMVFCLTYDNTGNYVTYLYDLNLVAFNQWQTMTGKWYQPSSAAIDGSNNKYYAISLTTGGIEAIKLNGNNAIQWFTPYRRSTTSVDTAIAVAADNAGNSFVVSASSLNGETDVWLMKLDANGDTLWSRTWGSSNGVNDEPLKMVYTTSPSAVVIAVNTIVNGAKAIVTLKYDANGTLMTGYPLTFTNPISTCTDFICDIYGNIYTTGYTGTLGSEDANTYKYKANRYLVSVVSVNGDSLYVTPAGSSYQWYKNNTLLPGETNKGIQLNPTYGNGQYYCLVEQYCSTYSTDTMNATTVGLHEQDCQGEPFTVTTDEGEVKITFKKETADVSIFVFDTQGLLITSRSKGRVSTGTTVVIDLPPTTNSYFLKVHDGNHDILKRIVTVR